MTIALNGDWGTGKTSALNIIKSHLGINPANGSSQATAYIDFDAWHYDVSDEGSNLALTLMLAFAEKIDELLDRDGDGKSSGKDENSKAQEASGVVLGTSSGVFGPLPRARD